METVLPELLQLLIGLGADALGNPAITGPIVVFALSRINGPFKLIAQGLASVLIETAKRALEQQREKAVQDAVKLAEQVATSNTEKLFVATQHAQKRTGLEALEASARVEAEVRRMKDYRAQAEADFAKVAAGKLNEVLGTAKPAAVDFASVADRLPIITLD